MLNIKTQTKHSTSLRQWAKWAFAKNNSTTKVTRKDNRHHSRQKNNINACIYIPPPLGIAGSMVSFHPLGLSGGFGLRLMQYDHVITGFSSTCTHLIIWNVDFLSGFAEKPTEHLTEKGFHIECWLFIWFRWETDRASDREVFDFGFDIVRFCFKNRPKLNDILVKNRNPTEKMYRFKSATLAGGRSILMS